ncbi:SDR family NAD(P)-dependent oxidoreductase [Terracoccus luteus]|uniref:Ketoreductase domain-containing protein n=1 Tax=Terracoccus luteus TaxID=53356 RepID=A0A839Q4K2_9MICO|nr:SDR family oxidoreductase [Terracoccus luteus]MBB2988092.1 hypothetical protein [Terracoccus luteus]MCP2173743.1 hypothetical protein [Terracoccus luteus]
MPTALITGATSGIGHEFAVQLAARGHDLVVVARNTERLEQVAQRLRDVQGVEVEVLTADLSDREALQRVADRVADEGRPVDVVVNNAGYGLKKRFVDNDLSVEEAHFDVHARATLVLSHSAARAMRGRDRGTIVNVSSVASFLATGTYSAAKSYVTVFTEGLAGELRGTGVQATAVCPGWVTTEFQERAEIGSPGPKFMWLETERVVRQALDDAGRGRVVSVPSAQYKAAVGVLRFVPRSLVRRDMRSFSLSRLFRPGRPARTT